MAGGTSQRDMRRRFAAVFIGIGWPGLMAGCGPVGSPQTGAESVEESHGMVAHKPHSFDEAVVALRDRFAVLVGEENEASGTAPTGERGVNELTDIVRWLPELAGDSDLGREDWYRVQATARDLEKLTAGWGERVKSGKWSVSEEERRRFGAALSVLELLRGRQSAVGSGR